MKNFRLTVFCVGLLALLTGCSKKEGSASAAVWKEFISDEGRFSVPLPGTPKQKVRTLSAEAGTVELHSFLASVDLETVYAVSYHDMPPGELDRKQILDSSASAAVGDGKLQFRHDIQKQDLSG